MKRIHQKEGKPYIVHSRHFQRESKKIVPRKNRPGDECEEGVCQNGEQNNAIQEKNGTIAFLHARRCIREEEKREEKGEGEFVNEERGKDAIH